MPLPEGAATWSDADAHKNFEILSARVLPGDPDGSRLLKHPLAEAAGGDVAAARRALDRAVRPTLPSHASLSVLRERLDPATGVILTCGNPSSMADIKRIAERASIRYEKEDWKVVLPARA